MKKLLIGIVIVTALAGALIFVGSAYAQGQVPPAQRGNGWGMGWMMGDGNRGMMGGSGRGMMDGYGMVTGQNDPMHEYMTTALAEKLGISVSDLNTALDNGKTMWQVAEEQGFSRNEVTGFMWEVHNTALEQAIADGVITAEQAEWMNNHMAQMQTRQGGFGSHCINGSLK